MEQASNSAHVMLGIVVGFTALGLIQIIYPEVNSGWVIVSGCVGGWVINRKKS